MAKAFLYRSYCFFYKVQKWRRRRFTMAGMAVGYMVFIAAILGTDIRISLVYQVFSLLGALLLIAFLWSRFLHRVDIGGERQLPRYATVGQPFVYQVTFKNRTAKPQKGLSFYEDTMDPLPTMEELLRLREPGEEKRNIWDRKVLYYRWLWIISKKRILEDKLHALPDLPANSSLKTGVKVIPQSRGYLHFCGFEMVRTDPFGLCRGLFAIPDPQKVVVLPKRYRLPPIHLPGARRHHARGVNLASSIGNQDEFVALRDYRPGDSMRQIHWKSSARKEKLVIKEYQDEFFARQALILDTFSDHIYSDAFEEAVAIAASFVCALQTQESLLDLIFVGDRAYRYSSGRGTASYDHLLEILAAVKACTDKPFETIAPAVFERIQWFSGCICVLLAWDEARMALVRDLKDRGVPLLVIVVVADGSPLPMDSGPMKGSENRFRVVKSGDVEKALAGL